MLTGRSFKTGGFALVIALLAAMVMAVGAQAYNHATQSHWGACSQNTLRVPHAVKDLNANRVLAQYARMIGVHWKKHHLKRAMRRALVVGHVKKSVVTANHGCTVNGLIFSVGSRTLHAGETVGVRLPKKYVGRACTGSHQGCKRLVVKRAVVFPTNCWNVNFGKVRVAIYVKPKVKKPKPKPVPKVAYPSASASLKCAPPQSFSLPGGGTLSVVLSDASKATASASFTVTVSGTSGGGTATYGPVAPGKSLTKTTSVDSSGNTVVLTVTSGGKTILSTQFPGGCPQIIAG